MDSIPSGKRWPNPILTPFSQAFLKLFSLVLLKNVLVAEHMIRVNGRISWVRHLRLSLMIGKSFLYLALSWDWTGLKWGAKMMQTKGFGSLILVKSFLLLWMGNIIRPPGSVHGLTAEVWKSKMLFKACFLLWPIHFNKALRWIIFKVEAFVWPIVTAYVDVMKKPLSFSSLLGSLRAMGVGFPKIQLELGASWFNSEAIGAMVPWQENCPLAFGEVTMEKYPPCCMLVFMGGAEL